VHTRRGFNLIELSVAVAIIAVLAAGVFYSYIHITNKAIKTDAIVSIKAIRDAEKAHKVESGSFVAADNTEEINKLLELSIRPHYYEYRVVNVTDDDFVVIAKRIGRDIDSNSVNTDSSVIVMNGGGEVLPSGPYVGGSGGGGGSSSSGADDSGTTSSGGGVVSGGGSTSGGNGTSGSDPGGGSSGGGGGGGSSGGGGGADDGADDGGGGGSEENASISIALNILQSSASGADEYALIQDEAISVIFDDFTQYGLSSDVMAFWWGIVQIPYM
jgi:prepilin-type N-terminal cleavage/methylation domain-containing protein